MFLCDQTTEPECLQKHLVGTTQLNALWCMDIQAGDDIYLFNFNTGVVRGPYVAISGVDCHDPTAWSGKFPIQVRISETLVTRQADNRGANTPPILKKRRPSGALGQMGSDVFAWLHKIGTSVA
jgi:Development and cell death domain